MTYEEIIETLRTYATETLLGDCPKDCPVKRRQWRNSGGRYDERIRRDA